MFEYRVTKYDPALRDPAGAYTADEWTSVSDIGRSFSGVILTELEYGRVEQAYISAAIAFCKEGDLTSLKVEELENFQNLQIGFEEGSMLSLDVVCQVIRRILREELWCRLEGQGGFVHFGYDFYMYIGVPRRCRAAEQVALDLGLFVEEFFARDGATS